MSEELENQDHVTEDAAPESQDDGLLQAEKALLADLEAGDTQGEEDTKTVESKQTIDANAPSFEVNGKMKLAAGQALTTEHIKELERGFLRESDYTRKTQELAKTRDEANGVLQAVEEIRQNPSALRQHFPAEHLLAAFQPQELLGWVMPRIGVSPQQWTSFLEWQKENGSEMPQSAQAYNPQNQAVAPLVNRLQHLEGKLTGWEKQSVAQQQAQAMNALDSEVKQACEKYSNVDRDKLLLAIQRDDLNKPVEELAREIADKDNERWEKYVESKTKKNGSAPRHARGSGQGHGFGSKKPQTFDDAHELAEQYFG